ncbi:MAG: DUF5074 domain-containing protein, partial [Bacteroidia bacterium]
TQANYVQVVDLTSKSITKNIRIDGWSEEMVQSYGKVYIANQSKKYVYVIDAATDELDSIYMGATNSCIIKDGNEKLWIACNASSTNNVSAYLKKINPVTNVIEDSISLNTTQNSISRLCINGAGTTLYFMINDVYKMDITSKTITDLISQGTHTFYGLCIDPDDETIYVSDAVDYNSNGKLYRYQSNGTLTNTFTVGLIPGFMLMD